MTSRDDVIKLAIDSMVDDEREGPRVILGPLSLEAFFHAAQKLGREECAKFFSDNDTAMFWGSQAAEHIRNRSNHETK